MEIVFFGTSDYCLPVLESLYKNFDLKLVITRPDKPVGRKKILSPSATKKWAIEHKISTLTPESLKKGTQGYELAIKQFSNSAIDLAIVADYGLIIPETIFNEPRLKTFNIHFSKLPHLRGPSPVQFTLLRGDTEAWVTIFQIEAQMDTGPILWQQSFSIDPNDTTQTLYTRLFQEVSKQLPNQIRQIGQIRLIPQLHQNATLCRYLTKEDGFIDWDVLQKAIDGKQLMKSELPQIQQEALTTSNQRLATIGSIYNFFRAVSPWPGMWTMKDEKRMIIRKCHLDGKKLILDEVQFEGKRQPTLFF